MQRIIKAAVDRGASDVHIKAGDVFRARINGELVPLTRQALTLLGACDDRFTPDLADLP